MSCNKCYILTEVMQGLEDDVLSLPDSLKELKSEVSTDQCLEEIENWNAHIVRCANQER